MSNFFRKRFLSTGSVIDECFHDEISRATPINSPEKFICIPNNTPEESSASTPLKTSISTPLKRNDEIPSFHTKLLRTLLLKVPDKIYSNSEDISSWIPRINDVPIITITPIIDSPVSVYKESKIQSMQEYQLPKSTSDIDYDHNTSFDDKFSTTATCDTFRSSLSLSDEEASFSDYEEERDCNSSFTVVNYLKRSGSVNLPVEQNKIKRWASMHNLLQIS